MSPPGYNSPPGQSSPPSNTPFAPTFSAQGGYTSPDSFLQHEAYTNSADMIYDANGSLASIDPLVSVPTSQLSAYPQSSQGTARDDHSGVDNDQTPVQNSTGRHEITPAEYPSQMHFIRPVVPTYPAYAPPIAPHMAIPYPVQTTTEGHIFYLSPGDMIPPGAVMYQRDPAPAPAPHQIPMHFQAPPPAQQQSQPHMLAKAPSLAGASSSTHVGVIPATTQSAPRPKTKLTHEDKRCIVMLSEGNSTLRQEDIARRYGVDRSTISKIMMNKHRWLGTATEEVSQQKSSRPVGGRFPVIEEKIHEWMDARLAKGLDCRDADAREEAKRIAREMGFSQERFKGSVKWWESVKLKRKQAGKPLTPLSSFPTMSQSGTSLSSSSTSSSFPPRMEMLSRSPSALTMSSSASSTQEMYHPSPVSATFSSSGSILSQQLHHHNYSETDLTSVEVTPTSRQRSQSSPQVYCEPGMQSPSSGRIRTSRPASLSRHSSYRGTSPSPRLVRGNSSSSQSGSIRRSRPTSLGASVFGITPINNEGPGSPLASPTYGLGHLRRLSDASQSTMVGIGNMSISSSVSSDSVPITPKYNSSTATFSSNEYADMSVFPDYGQPGAAQMPHGAHSVHGHHPAMVPQYPTMPNKHYEAQYSVQPAYVNEFGVATNPSGIGYQ